MSKQMTDRLVTECVVNRLEQIKDAYWEAGGKPAALPKKTLEQFLEDTVRNNIQITVKYMGKELD